MIALFCCISLFFFSDSASPVAEIDSGREQKLREGAQRSGKVILQEKNLILLSRISFCSFPSAFCTELVIPVQSWPTKPIFVSQAKKKKTLL